MILKIRFSAAVLSLSMLSFFGCAGDVGSDQNQQMDKEGHKPAVVEKAVFPPEQVQRFNAFFTRLPDNKPLNGNVLIYHEGKTFENSYGFANITERDTLKGDEVFQLASVSKPITATLIMLLQEKGLLNIKDTVNYYFPDFPYEDITLEMLLSHRSGLPNYMYLTDAIWEDKDLAMCNENILDSLITKAPDPYYPPNSRFNYCNTNYFLLAAIVEKVTDMKFESAAEKYIFKPLDMMNTFVYSDMDYVSIPNVAPGHNAFGRAKADFYLNGVTGDKGVFSTTEDLLRFDLALKSEALISRESIEDMYKTRSKFDSKGLSYGLGWRINKNYDVDVIYHNGWWRGYRTYFLRVPEKDLAVIILTNTTRGSFLKSEDLMRLVKPLISTVRKPTGSAGEYLE